MLNLLIRTIAVVFRISITLFALTTYAQNSQATFSPEPEGYKLYGVARQTDDLGRALFYCALYLQNGSATPMPKPGDVRAVLAYDKGMIMEFRASANISQRNLVNGWMSAIAVNNPEKIIDESIRHIVRFKELFSFDIQPRDVIRYSYKPETYTTDISINGVTVGNIEDDRFFKLLLNMWQGDVPPDSDFKNSIVGKPVNDRHYRNDVELAWGSLLPDPERITAIKNLLTADTQPLVKESVASIAPKKEPPVQSPAENTSTSPAKHTLRKTAQKPPPRETSTPPGNNKPQLTKNTTPSPNPSSGDDHQPTHTLSALEVKSAESEAKVEKLRKELLAYNRYVIGVINKLRGEIKYPPSARLRKQEGVVEIDLIIQRDGSTEIQMRKPSKIAMFNDAVKIAVQRAAPFPEIPPSIKTETLRLIVPPLKFSMPK